MSAYLYTWIPNKWKWLDLQEAIYKVNNGEDYDTSWSCGNTKRILTGDKFLLMRLGVEPKGIVGCGYVSSALYDLPHWDESKADNGKTASRTDVLFKSLSEKPLISLELLQQRYPAYRWTPQMGGVSVPDEIATEIFSEIQANKKSAFTPQAADDIKRFSEGKVRSVTYQTYDRSPAARQACLEHFGYNCDVCNFNFHATYGAIGESYIEVHHLRQIADSEEEHLINPITDLRPVCANCHRMLHKQRPPLSIEELKAKIKNANK
ncbi:HNH endonuclease [Leucothrix sargassi]|nr:HNH endonuclease [Leucothrix sargassi]